MHFDTRAGMNGYGGGVVVVVVVVGGGGGYGTLE